MQAPQVVNYPNNINQDVVEFTENYNGAVQGQIELEEESDIPDINDYEEEKIGKCSISPF